MTIVELACIVCSAGWAVALTSFVLWVIAGKALDTLGGRSVSVGVSILLWTLVLSMVAGVVGCSVEDRVCEAASR